MTIDRWLWLAATVIITAVVIAGLLFLVASRLKDVDL